MIIENTKGRLIKACLANLREHLGLEVKVETPRAHHGDMRPEIIIGTRPITHLAAEIRTQPRLTREQVRHIILDADRLRHQTLKDLIVLAERIDDEAAEAFRKGGVFYADTLGNAYFRPDDRGILIDVRRPRVGHHLKAEPGRLIEPGGLKVIHYLLTRIEGDLPPYRQMAEGAEVALGTVAVVIRELEGLGHITRTGPDTRRLARQDDLIELFVRGYALKLRPACWIGRFRHRNTNIEGLADGLHLTLLTQGINHALTGGYAAEFLTRHLTPDTVALFLQRPAVDGLLKKEQMLPDDQGGNVILLDYFAPTVLDEKATKNLGVNLATPLLIYAELLKDGRPRELEAAEIILKTYLRPGP